MVVVASPRGQSEQQPGDHSGQYYDADEDYLIAVTGTLSLTFPVNSLDDGDLVEDDIPDLIESADESIEVAEISVLSAYDRL